MPQIFDENASNKATNVIMNSDLLAKARKPNASLFATFEHALDGELRKAEQDGWLKSNINAVNKLNELADKNGLFSDAYRKF